MSFQKKGEEDMFRKNSITIFAYVLLSSIVFPAHPSPSRGLLIFLDDSETDIRAVSNSLLAALYQQAGPILASASLLRNIFSDYNELYKKEDPNDLVKRFRRARAFKDDEGQEGRKAKKEEKYILLRALAFDPTAWTIKKINDSLYLLIPHAYLKKLTINIDSIKMYDPSKISDIELQVGLKVNHMELVTIEDILKQSSKGYNYADYFIEALYFIRIPFGIVNILKEMSAIFCTHADYAHNVSNQPIWSLYMTGHGNMNESIVGLKLDDFKKLLDFLEHTINVRLLIYNSCYAAGLNTEIIYKDAKSAIQRTYSFAIITQAITDAPVAGLRVMVELSRDGRLTLETFENFADFLKEVTSSEVVNYEKAATTIFPLLPKEELKFSEAQVWGNIPQIKLPGIEWFSVMASRKDIVSIGSILAKTRDPRKSLNVVNFFKTDPKAILLYAADIPFELVIDSKNLEAIISMIPGDAVHVLKRISSSTKNPKEILNWFMAISMLDSYKIFFIEEINTIKNVIIYNKKIPSKNIMIPDRYENYAFYSDGGTLYVQKPYEGAQPADEKQKTFYQRILNNIQGKPNQFGSFIFKTEESIQYKLPPVRDLLSIIDKLEGEKGSLIYMTDILYWLGNAVSSSSSLFKSIVWVKEMSGDYDGTRMNLPDVKKDEFITINDVIIESGKQPFFIYKNNFYQGKNNIGYDYRTDYKKRMKITEEPAKKPTPAEEPPKPSDKKVKEDIAELSKDLGNLQNNVMRLTNALTLIR